MVICRGAVRPVSAYADRVPHDEIERALRPITLGPPPHRLVASGRFLFLLFSPSLREKKRCWRDRSRNGCRQQETLLILTGHCSRKKQRHCHLGAPSEEERIVLQSRPVEQCQPAHQWTGNGGGSPSAHGGRHRRHEVRPPRVAAATIEFLA